jgi:hypothetical protein
MPVVAGQVAKPMPMSVMAGQAAIRVTVPGVVSRDAVAGTMARVSGRRAGGEDPAGEREQQRRPDPLRA